ncbi:MAG: sugar ABC transporter substrate-binding protein [Lachnospiraceae bacterium]|nr:sugar ABC transporter substrate-binding protein [Lachnospiraceae bacterium]
MKKAMKALAIGVAAVMTLGSLSVYADGKVGICLPTRDQYWTTFETSLGQNLEAEGYEYQTVVAGDQGEEVSTQISQVQTFNNNGFDAVVIGMATGGSGNDFMQNVGDMKTVFFNRAVEDGVTDGTQSVYIGMAEYDAGHAQGEWLANYFKEQGKTELKGMMFMGVLGQDAVTNRTQGAKDALEENGITVDWVFEQTGEWDRTKAMNLFTQFAGTGAEFDFVCSNNDEMALGVVEACSAMNMDITFPIVGVDATEVGCNAVKNGTMAMTVNQDPKGQSVVVVAAIKALLEGETPEGMSEGNKIATAAVAITPDNVDEVLEGFRS